LAQVEALLNRLPSQSAMSAFQWLQQV